MFKTSFLFLILLQLGCTSSSGEKNYILAERFWETGNYREAAKEFTQVYQKNPKSKLGLKALFRAAKTKTLFLDQQVEAIEAFKIYIDHTDDPVSKWEAQKEIGEILFSKMKNYAESIRYYESLIKLNGEEEEKALFLYRVARSHYHLWQFGEAVRIYRKLVQLFPESELAEKANFQIGMTYFTGGNESFTFKKQNAYQKAITAFEQFIENYPQSIFTVEAKFGIASCYVEMDLLEEAVAMYEQIKEIYPSPKVVQIKLIRIKDRMAKKGQ